MSVYAFPRLRRLHRAADMWPEYFFDVLHLATCELEAGPMRRLDGAVLLNGPLPDTGYRHRSHVAAVAVAVGRSVTRWRTRRGYGEAERWRILRGDPCLNCGEVCTGIEDCVSRIAAAIRRARGVG